ncbi:MAG: response regulator [Gammaproteobacteria bacterium]|nr:response regulator [Gammaproteobacteria bacterium]
MRSEDSTESVEQMQLEILCVDDEPLNLMVLEDVLAPHYKLYCAANGQQALEFLQMFKVELILLDIIMPGMDGYETCRRIKSNPLTRNIPVLFISSLQESTEEAYGLSLGAEDFIHKPFAQPVVLARIHTQLELARARQQLRERNRHLQTLVEERTRDLLWEKQQVIAAQSATITALCTLAEIRDNETGNHIRRTQNYIRVLAEQLQDHPRFSAELNEEVINLLFRSAPLHDIGKVAIPDAILHKPDKLTVEEWQVMQTHPVHGRNAIVQAEAEIGDSASFLRYAREIAYSHHEKWDGSGYPEGLAGEAIPLSARLMALADVYDALISKRVYKPAFSHEQSLQIISEGRGSHFDPDMVDALLALGDRFKQIALEFQDME